MRPPQGRCWALAESTFLSLVKDGRIWFGDDGKSRPRQKRFLSETGGSNAWTWWDNNSVGHNQEGSKIIKDLLGSANIFTNPKPVRLLRRIVALASNDNSIIMDFFSGSATTAHAVMQLNAEDGGKRKFILVQLPEPCAEDSEAAKAGYKTICDIGEERIRRAGAKIVRENNAWKYVPLNRLDGSEVGDYTPAKIVDVIDPDDNRGQIEMVDVSKDLDDLDIGFRVFRVDSTNMKDVYYRPGELKQEELELFASNIKEDRTPEDLLFQVMLDLGVPLSSKIEESSIDGKKVFSVADGYLIACFDDDVTEETVKAISQKRPFYAVFRDSGMATDSVMTNFEQIFKTYSPTTVRRVL